MTVTGPAPPPRLLSLLLRPTSPPLRVGIAVAVGLITAETLLVYVLRQAAPEHSFGAVFLLGVLIVSASWGLGLAMATSVASALVYVHFHMQTHGALIPVRAQDAVAIAIFLPLALLINVLVGQARLRTAESEQRRVEADLLARQQAALRRVATLVARGAPPDVVYPAAVEELALGMAMDHVTLVLYPGDGSGVVLASRDSQGVPKFTVGERLSLDEGTIAASIAATGKPARVDDYETLDGPTAARVRGFGMRSAAGAPVTVEGQVRGLLAVGSARPSAFGPDIEANVGDFADLVATAIANAQTRAALTASRARIATAADQARRRFERDLHDGAQQRVVSLGLALRAVEASVPPDQPELRAHIGLLVAGLSALSTELQELSRGIHPAILSRSGLGPAIRSLARRCPVAVELHLDLDTAIPESVSVAAYYVVAEALTNAAKHAGASVIEVGAAVADDVLELSIRDDGAGGAVAGTGSGLVGLRDRVEALSGQLTISSPPGAGTTLTARIPLHLP